MRTFRLRTLGGIRLDGPTGSVPLDEPALAAFVVMLALSESGVSEDELLLRLFPDHTASRARAELAGLVELLRSRLGHAASVVHTGNRYAFAPGVVRADVGVASQPSDEPNAAFLAGFSSPSPEFREWVDAMRRRVERIAPVAQRVVRSRRTVAIGIAAGLLLLAVSLGVLWRARAEATPIAGATILLADVRNETGDSLFDGLNSAARIGLEQSDRLTLHPRWRVPEVYRRMGIARIDTPLSLDLAYEVAEREAVRFVFGLTIGRIRDGFVVSGTLADLGQRSEYVATANAGSANNVMAALDSVLRDVRRELGESRQALASDLWRLPDVTTPSLEALRSYSGGAWAWDVGDYPLARDLFARAVELDSGFATALGALGSYWYYFHNRELGERYFAAALGNADRVTERERLRILQNWMSYRNNFDSSIALSRLVAERYPSFVTWENYGGSLLRAHRDEEAAVAFRRALTYDSTSVLTTGAWINLATALARLGHEQQSLDAYHMAFRVDSTTLYRGNLNHEYGQKLVRAGRVAEAESAYARMASQPSMQARASGFRSLGYLAMWRGHTDAAARYFAQAVESSIQNNTPLTELRNRMLLSWALDAAGRTEEANAELDRAMRLIQHPSAEPGYLSLMVFALARHGRPAPAESLLALLRSRMDPVNVVDSAAEAMTSATVALIHDQPERALAALRRAEKFPQRIFFWSVIADAYAATGQRDSAIASLRQVLATEAFGYEGQIDWLRTHIRLGDLLLANGDTAAARAAYQELLTHWREAPDTTPAILQARRRITALAAGRDIP
jgi:tetratricopeptide (TPR) repeat protein